MLYAICINQWLPCDSIAFDYTLCRREWKTNTNQCINSFELVKPNLKVAFKFRNDNTSFKALHSISNCANFHLDLIYSANKTRTKNYSVWDIISMTNLNLCNSNTVSPGCNFSLCGLSYHANWACSSCLDCYMVPHCVYFAFPIFFVKKQGTGEITTTIVIP